MQQVKAFSIRIPKDTWIFLKKLAAEQEMSMMQIIKDCLETHRKKYEKKMNSTVDND
jgi:hypothetical protein